MLSECVIASDDNDDKRSRCSRRNIFSLWCSVRIERDFLLFGLTFTSFLNLFTFSHHKSIHFYCSSFYYVRLRSRRENGWICILIFASESIMSHFSSMLYFQHHFMIKWSERNWKWKRPRRREGERSWLKSINFVNYLLCAVAFYCGPFLYIFAFNTHDFSLANSIYLPD